MSESLNAATRTSLSVSYIVSIVLDHGLRQYTANGLLARTLLSIAEPTYRTLNSSSCHVFGASVRLSLWRTVIRVLAHTSGLPSRNIRNDLVMLVRVKPASLLEGGGLPVFVTFVS